MDLLRKFGQGCRQHYEKILLTLVLLGLALAVWYLNEESKKEDEKIKVFLKEVETRSKSNIKPVDFSEYEVAMRLGQNPPPLNFALPHNLFNPVKWQRRPNNELIKVQTGEEVGWPQMTILKVRPLEFTIALDQVPNAGGYFLGLTREAADKPIERKKKRFFASLNGTNQFYHFVLREAKGPPDNPELVVEFTDSNERATLSKDKPYVKVEGYEADLKYSVDGKTFPNLRVGSSIRFLGEAYNIVAISPSEVVASAQLNDRKYSVRQVAAAPW